MQCLIFVPSFLLMAPVNEYNNLCNEENNNSVQTMMLWRIIFPCPILIFSQFLKINLKNSNKS